MKGFKIPHPPKPPKVGRGELAVNYLDLAERFLAASEHSAVPEALRIELVGSALGLLEKAVQVANPPAEPME